MAKKAHEEREAKASSESISIILMKSQVETIRSRLNFLYNQKNNADFYTVVGLTGTAITGGITALSYSDNDTNATIMGAAATIGTLIYAGIETLRSRRRKRQINELERKLNEITPNSNL